MRNGTIAHDPLLHRHFFRKVTILACIIGFLENPHDEVLIGFLSFIRIAGFFAFLVQLYD